MFVSFLGLGQGGSNIADEASRRGFYSAAINFSERDLESLEFIEKKLKLVGSEGIGKQRNNAISLMNNNWDLATNFVKENFSHSTIEIIFVPFATAGGSGSGIAPVLLQLLIESMPDKVFVAMPIIPDMQESFLNQKNCLEAFDDLSTLDICILPIDNDKAKSTLSNIGKNNLYKKINECVISRIEKIVSYTNNQSKYGVIDKKDIRSIFSTSGIATIGEVDVSQMTHNFNMSREVFANRIKESWSNSFFADVEYEKVISAGFIYDGQETLMEFIGLDEVFSDFKNKMPISLYEGYYTDEKGTVVTILAGLPWCNSRLKEVDEIILQTNEIFKNLNQPTFYKSQLSDNTLPNLTSNTMENKKVNDISSIISKFKR